MCLFCHDQWLVGNVAVRSFGCRWNRKVGIFCWLGFSEIFQTFCDNGKFQWTCCSGASPWNIRCFVVGTSVYDWSPLGPPFRSVRRLSACVCTSLSFSPPPSRPRGISLLAHYCHLTLCGCWVVTVRAAYKCWVLLQPVCSDSTLLSALHTTLDFKQCDVMLCDEEGGNQCVHHLCGLHT